MFESNGDDSAQMKEAHFFVFFFFFFSLLVAARLDSFLVSYVFIQPVLFLFFALVYQLCCKEG